MDISRQHHKKTTARIPPGSLVGLFALAVIIAVISVSTLRLGEKRSLVKSLRNQARREYEQLQASYDQVLETIEASATPEGQERIIRQNMRAVQEGEEIVVVVPEQN